jgi:hypothetical protein
MTSPSRAAIQARLDFGGLSIPEENEELLSRRVGTGTVDFARPLRGLFLEPNISERPNFSDFHASARRFDVKD